MKSIKTLTLNTKNASANFYIENGLVKTTAPKSNITFTVTKVSDEFDGTGRATLQSDEDGREIIVELKNNAGELRALVSATKKGCTLHIGSAEELANIEKNGNFGSVFTVNYDVCGVYEYSK